MKKGISLVSVGIIVIVVGILSSVVFVQSSRYIKNIDKVKFVTEYITIETALNKYNANNDGYPILEDESIELSISEYADISQFDGETITDNVITLSKIDMLTLGFDNLEFGNGESPDDYYAISSDTNTIYYVKGFEYDGKMYYRVAGELGEN